MSFSSDIKEELSKSNTLADKTQVKAELIGYLFTNNTNMVKDKVLRYSTESEYNINRFSKLLSNLKINHQITIEGNTFVITLKAKELPFELTIQELEENEESKKSMIRGAFLGSGSINNPQNGYHLEIGFLDEKIRDEIKNILEKDFNIQAKKINVQTKKAIYIKDGEEISKLLALMGANRGLLKFEDIRVQKDMRGKINRLVNCESANLNKTINASIEQIEAIQKLQRENKFNMLDDNLKEIATIRLENPNMPLAELGKKLKNPIGKSGVNYRLKKIIDIAFEK